MSGLYVARNGYILAECPVHGHVSFNTIVEGCEECARERLAIQDQVRVLEAKHNAAKEYLASASTDHAEAVRRLDAALELVKASDKELNEALIKSYKK